MAVKTIEHSIEPEAFEYLGQLEGIVNSVSTAILPLDIKFFRPCAIVYLDQILRKRESQKSRLEVYSTYSESNTYLRQCGFNFIQENAQYSELIYPEPYIIKLQHFDNSMSNVDEIVQTWVSENIIVLFPSLSEKLEKKIVENLWEIVDNGLTHGNSDFGVSACGQFYPLRGYFEIAFHDIGIGIPGLVKMHKVVDPQTPDFDCIKWAMERGNSTKPKDKSAGLGLFFLREFVKINQGAFQISSGNGYFGNLGEKEPKSHELENYINGTLVNIRIIYDNKLYYLN